MKTSWNNTALIEQYLQNRLSPTNRMLFEARLILNPCLRKDLLYQKRAHILVKMYHRKKVKEQLERMYHKVFTSPENIGFQQSIYSLFKIKDL